MTSLVPALVVLPLLGALAHLSRQVRTRAPAVLMGVGAALSLVAAIEAVAPEHGLFFGRYIRLDATARLFLSVVNPVFLGVSVYVRGRLLRAPSLAEEAARFAWMALVFLGASNLVLVSNHLGLQWLALEASALAAAPMIARASSPASRQASFRYLLFSSVGLGLVLLGLACLERAMVAAGRAPTLFLDALPTTLAGAEGPWRTLGLLLVLLGLGTKLGLAPMYSWLPEAYDEAPPATTALLGAVQFNCALVMLFRVVQVARGTDAPLVTNTLVTMGVVSMVVSTFSIIATRNVKRLISYASINHAGVIAIGLGVGKAASFGLLLYVLSNAFIKAILFLTAGNIEAHYKTKDTRKIAGLLKDLPYSGVFLMVGTFALLGFPPFGSFVGELLILSALVSSGKMLVFAVFCLLITMTFVATGRTIFPMIWGEATRPVDWPKQTFASASPKVVFLVALVVLGVYIPSVVNALVLEVASSLGAEGAP